MAIAKSDWELMKQVADYFESTEKNDANDKSRRYKLTRDSRSINETASHFHITRSKAMKMLITMEFFSTPVSRSVQELRTQGMSIKQIAEELGVSVGTVSSNLSYEEEFHGSDTPSEHAAAMREYRAYERMQKERQVQERKEQDMDSIQDMDSTNDWKKDLDSKLSFTATESRRPGITYEMVRGAGKRARAVLEASGMKIPGDDRAEERERLRAKENLTPDEKLDLGEFPGALYDRNTLDLEELYGEDLPYEPREMIRLHLELEADFSDAEKEVMQQYGGMKGETISRDIVVSDDLPLYALHYVIQRAFGFTNSHLHRFYISDERVEKFTGSVERWMHQVGVIYRSPLMDEDAEFWADDYERGSFKNWLRKKYTGPCVSQCWGEGLMASRESMERVDLDQEFYVEYGYYEADRRYEPDYEPSEADSETGGEQEHKEEKVMPLRCRPVYSWDGNKYDPPEPDEFVKGFRVEVVKLRDLPIDLLSRVFDRGAFDLLERLPIGEVLTVSNMHCKDDYQSGEDVSTYQEMLDDGMDDEIDEILSSGLDSPMKQPIVYSFTDELLYQYDFGDNWTIRITGSRNCVDLVGHGKIKQEMLDKSNIKARVTYRPVLIARDGEMLIEDVGGTSGMVEFIRAINTMHRGETDENGMSKTELKNWAKSQGWHKDDSTDYNLL